jgi:hypothetical protein
MLFKHPNRELRYRKVPRTVPIRTKINLNGDPLVSEETFQQVQAILSGINTEYVTRCSNKTKFEVSGLLRCPCGKRYYSKHDSRPGKSGYYLCKSGYLEAAKGCGNPHLRRSDIDRQVVWLLGQQLGDPVRLSALVNACPRPTGNEGLIAERRKLLYRLETATNRRTKLVDRIADGTFSDEEAAVSLSKLRSEVEELKSKIQAVDERVAVKPIPGLQSVLSSVVALFAQLPFRTAEHRKELLRKVLQELQIGGDSEIESITIKMGEGRVLRLQLR